MRTRLIDRRALDIGAVLPECLDNQYVSDKVFEQMQEKKVGFNDPGIAELRKREALNEYRRSLVYGRQIVVQRAYLFTPMVYEDFEDVPGNERNRAAFKSMVDEAAIVPYLFNERDLSDSSRLSESERALTAFRSLGDLFDEVTCVRMHVDDHANKTEIGRMAQEFQAYCLSLRGLRNEPQLLNTLAAEVLRRDMTNESLAGFGEALDEISRTAWAVADRRQTVTRTHIYQHLLNEPNQHYDKGLFRADTPGTFILAKKKVVDLRYNTNLPDFLRRYSFTPTGLPTRAALMTGPSADAMSDGDRLLDELRTQIRQTVMSRIHEACVLPPLRSLSLDDVLEIRRLPEWLALMNAQATILKDPRRCLHHLEAFADAFSAFQRSFSAWYYRVHSYAERVTRYGAVVRIAVKVLSRIAMLQVPGVTEKVFLAVGPELLPDKAYQFTARLLVDVVDLATGIPDPERSYSVDMMTAGLELTREDVHEILACFGRVAPALEGANAGAG